MDRQVKRTDSITSLLVGLVLLATVGVLASLFPIFPCPRRAELAVVLFDTPEGTQAAYPVCSYCGREKGAGFHQQGRATLLKWLQGEMTPR
jgi:hypothetical protein